ncbi:reverse transcriptase family protein [Burkholderia gladioli]|uniref:reverse transcriptase family protein n=1 Tax=Burkholderia gladioli TaxID=28095 RepID=UPI002FE3B3D6
MPGHVAVKLPARKNRSIGYDINQSHLFRIGSPDRLSIVLGVGLETLLDLSRRSDNYKIFQKEGNDPFSRTHRRSRDIQEPKETLKKIHRRVAKLLKFVRVPGYLHSAVKGVSYRTNAIEHATRGVSILTMDIEEFYSSTDASRVFNFFCDVLQCAPDVSKLISKLLTWRGVLATGSPASPLLSFHCNRPMFDEMAAIATRKGHKFTCYVDDITFSGACVRRGLATEISRIAYRHGHRIKERKTRFYCAGQAGIVTGVVVDDGSVSVPHERRLKGRRIEVAIDSTIDPIERLALTEKLMGLAGEAAYLDNAFRPWVDSIRGRLKILRRSRASGRS